MAVIGRIRKHSSLAVIIVGVAIAAFVLSDLFKGGGRTNPPVVVINGEEITYNDFNIRLEQGLENARLNSGKENLSAREIMDVRAQTWNGVLTDEIMGKEYDELGLIVSPDELFDQVQGPNPHSLIRQYFVDPQTNMYDPQLVLRYLQNLDQMDPQAKQQWLELERFIKKDRRVQKYNNLVTNGYYIPRPFAQMDFDSKRKSAEVRYLAAKFADISDSIISVTEADYEAYYDKNSYQFEQEESRDIDYVVFDILPSESDREATREKIFNLYDEFLASDEPIYFVNSTSDNNYDSSWRKKGTLAVEMDSIMFSSPIGTNVPPYLQDEAWHFAKLLEIQNRPDSMKAEHILIAYAGALRAVPEAVRTKEEAELLADSLLNVVTSGNVDFGALAKEYSNDQSAQQNNGDLGWFADGMMVYPFNQAVFEGETGDYTLAESQFGYHVIKITGKKDFSDKVRLAIVDRALEASSQTDQDIYVEASRFAFENKTMNDFMLAVNEEGLNLRSGTFLRQDTYTMPGIDNAREIVRWTYNEDFEEGDVIPKVFDVDGQYVVAVLKAIRNKGVMPLDQVRTNITTFVTNEKKTEYIMDQIESAPDNDMYQLASAMNAKVDTNTSLTFSARNIPGFGSEYSVIGSIFAMNEGDVSDPLQGNGGVFIVALDKMNEPTESSNLSIYKNQLEATFKSRITGNVIFTALQKESNIEDNRILYY